MGLHPIPYYIVAFVLLIVFGYLWPVLPITGGYADEPAAGLELRRSSCSVLQHSHPAGRCRWCWSGSAAGSWACARWSPTSSPRTTSSMPSSAASSRGRILALLRDAQRAGAAGHRARHVARRASSTAPSSPSRCSAIRASARCWSSPCMPATTAWCSASPRCRSSRCRSAVLLIDLLYPLLDPRVKVALSMLPHPPRPPALQPRVPLGVVLLSAIVVCFAALSFVSPYPPQRRLRRAARRAAVAGPIWFGTTSRGQDVFWQLTFAIRNTLLFGIAVALLSRLLSLVDRAGRPATRAAWSTAC